jgi:hypothetical protein
VRVAVAVDTAQETAKAMRDEEMLAEIEHFIEGFNQPPIAVCGLWGSGRDLVIPARVVRGQPPEAEWLQ